jgi:hypothetical protein
MTTFAGQQVRCVFVESALPKISRSRPWYLEHCPPFSPGLGCSCSPTCLIVCALQSSLLKLIKEDYRRRQLTASEVRLEDILGDIEANPVKFTVASSLTDDRQWLHFVAQQGAPRPLRRLVENGADIHARDAVRPSADVRAYLKLRVLTQR